jgi:hypothetical protein
MTMTFTLGADGRATRRWSFVRGDSERTFAKVRRSRRQERRARPSLVQLLDGGEGAACVFGDPLCLNCCKIVQDDGTGEYRV